LFNFGLRMCGLRDDGRLMRGFPIALAALLTVFGLSGTACAGTAPADEPRQGR